MRSFTLNLGGLLLGEDLELVKGVNVVVEDGKIVHIGKGWSQGADLRGFIALPPLVNSHVHSADFALRDFGIKESLVRLVGDPNSLKFVKLLRAEEEEAVEAIREFKRRANRFGTLALVDFREGGIAGALQARKAKVEGLKHLVLSAFYNEDEARAGRELVDGVGVPSISSLRDWHYSLFKDKIRAIHVSETLRHYLRRDFERAIEDLKPHFVVHATHLKREDFEGLQTPVVFCPRSNLWHGVGIPRIAGAIEARVKVMLGTDNGAWNEPDVLEEAKFAYYLTRLERPQSDFSRELLKAITVNAYGLVGFSPVNEGVTAHLVLVRDEGILDSPNPHSALLKRGRVHAVLNFYRF